MNNLNLSSNTFLLIKNSFFSSVNYLLNIILQLITRYIFLIYFSIEFLGLNSFFSGLLFLFSIADLGFSNGLIYFLYEPLANNDYLKVKKLLFYFLKIYRIISLFIFAFGLFFMPFLVYFIDNYNDLNIYIIYLIFLINTVLNYLFTPYKNVIVADQKNYKLIKYNIILTIFQFGFQIFTIVILKNFYAFNLIQLLYTLISIFFMLKFFKDNYTYLKKYKLIDLSNHEKNIIFQNIKSLLYFKVGSIFLNGSENLLITIIFGIRILGLVSNYQVIIVALTNFASSILNGFMASIGNLQAKFNYDKEPSFYKTLNFSLWLYGLIGIGLLFQIEDFIILWIGDQFVINYLVVYGIVFSLLINNSNFAAYAFRTTSGLFNKIKFLPLLAAILNLFFSILLAIFFGLPGIFFGSGLARLVTFSIIDPYLVYKFNLKKSVKVYYIKLIIFFLFFILNYLLINFIFSVINFIGIFGFFLNTLIITIIFSTLFYLLYKNDKHLLPF